MDNQHDISQLKAQVEQLTAENAALREAGFRGSKAEALMALEYDRIPAFMKSQRSVVWQRRIATAVMIVVPVIVLAVVIVGGVNAYRDRQQQLESHAAMDRIANDFQSDPAFKPRK